MNVFWNSRERRLRAFWRIFLQTATIVLLSAGAFIVLMSVGGISGRPIEEDPLLIVVSNLVMIAAVAICGRVLDRRVLTDFGMQWNSSWFVDFSAGLLLAAFSLVAMLCVMLAFGWVRVSPTIDVVSQLPMLVVWLIAFVSVGFGEELLARGYYLRNLSEAFRGGRMSANVAVLLAFVVSSVVFGVLHIPNPNMTPMAAANLCLAGVVLGLPAVLTGRLGMSVGFHIGWNYVLGNVLGFPVSGLPMQSRVLETESVGPEWITGGPFGPEGGVIGLVMNLASIALVVAYVKMGEGRIAVWSSWAEYDPPGWRRMPWPSPAAPETSDGSAAGVVAEDSFRS